MLIFFIFANLRLFLKTLGRVFNFLEVSLVILELKNISKTYPSGRRALQSISFKIEEGEILAIIGLSGAGKSTMLRCINRLVEPDEGEVIF